MISIVIPTLNEGSRINVLLGQLINFDGVGEIVVVDASYPLTEITHNSEKIIFLQAKKRGRAAQMNQGATICSLDAIVFLHCDTRMPNNASCLVKTALEEFRWGRFDIKFDSPDLRFRIIETMINLRSRLTNLATGDQAIFVNRKWFEVGGGFVDIQLMEDIEFSKRVSKQFPPALIKTKVMTSARRWINDGTVRTIFKMWTIRFLYWCGVSPNKLATLYHDAR